MADQIEEIKNKIDIVELISEYVTLKRAGRNFKGLCPFHGEKTPSFMVNPELSIFKCFGCGEGGDVFAFLQKMEGMEFGEALRTLAKRAGVVLTGYQMNRGEEEKEKLLAVNRLAGEYYHFLLTKHKLGQGALKYLTGRGITAEVIETFKLGYAPSGWDFLMRWLVEKKGFRIEVVEKAGLTGNGRYDRFRDRVMFPLNNHRGQTVGFAGRILPVTNNQDTSNKVEQAKYVNTPETEIYHKGELLYGLDINKAEIKKAGWVVVVEGEIDSIASYLAGVKNVVAIKGSALTERQVELLRRYAETVVLGLDADAAGDAAVRRGIEVAQRAGLIIKIVDAGSEKVNPKKFKDPGDWGIADPEGWQRAVGGAIPIYDFYIESAVARHGLDAVGKQRVGRELVPIWARIGDEIVKAHYVKKLAGVLGVAEEDVRAELGKVTGGKTQDKTGSPSQPAGTVGGREVREERVVQLAILGQKEKELVNEPVAGWIRSDFWRRVVGELAEGKTVKDLPAELGERVKLVFLTEEEFGEKGWEEAKNLLELAVIEEELGKVTEAVEVDKLAKRKAELTKGR